MLPEVIIQMTTTAPTGPPSRRARSQAFTHAGDIVRTGALLLAIVVAFVRMSSCSGEVKEVLMSSHPLEDGSAEDALGSHEEDQDGDAEHEGVAEARGDVRRSEVVEHAD